MNPETLLNGRHRPYKGAVDEGGVQPVEACEVCGSCLRPWSSRGGASGLFRCAGCGHLARRVDGAGRMREHPWGGSSGFDRIRLGLTMRRIGKVFLRGGRPPSVLEIGFGSGALLRKLLDRGCAVAGAEKDMLGVAVDPEVIARGRLFHGGYEEAPLPENEFDLVLAIHLIEHVGDVREFARACHRALRPGGRLYLLTPNADSAGLAIFGDAWWNLEDPSHVRFFSPASARRLLESAGFGRVVTGSPAWDSVMVEANSLWRWLGVDAGKNGVMGRGWIRALDFAALPCSLLARLFYRRLASSLEVIAEKGPGP